MTWIRICVVLGLSAAALTSQTLRFPAPPTPLRFQRDPVRGTQAKQELVADTSGHSESEVARRDQELERLRFEARFREFVKAMNSFIDRYNSGDGNVWPQHEADQVGKAMRNIQDIFQAPQKTKK